VFVPASVRWTVEPEAISKAQASVVALTSMWTLLRVMLTFVRPEFTLMVWAVAELLPVMVYVPLPVMLTEPVPMS
jgi:hypothetical protein